MNTVYFEHPKFWTGSIELSAIDCQELMNRKVNRTLISTEIGGTDPNGVALFCEKMPYELHFIQ
jgi:hypothetical protein